MFGVYNRIIRWANQSLHVIKNYHMQTFYILGEKYTIG